MATDAGPSPQAAVALGILLREWRRRALLSQEELAAASGLGVRTIRRLESDDGRRRPQAASIRRLADALRLSETERQQLVAAAQPTQPARSEPRAGVDGFGPVPGQLPADVAGFAGRVEYLHRLDAMLDRRGAANAVVITALGGTAGVGKTALAVHWAHRVAAHFPDGQLYVNLRGFDPSGTPTEPETALRGFLDALGVPLHRIPPDLDRQAALYRSLLAGRRVLIVLDNARDAGQVRPLLPGSSGCVAVVTSRNKLTGLVAGSAAESLTLDLMSDVEARAMLAGRLGADRVAANQKAVNELITLCARLPLALAVVAARAAANPPLTLEVLTGEMRDAQARLESFATGDAATDVRAVFSWSYHQLSAEAARLFRLLGLHPGPDLSIPAAASLAGERPDQTRQLLTELTQARLLTEHLPGRYTLHDLLRAYTAEVVAEEPNGERHEATHRMLDHYVRTAWEAATLLYPHRDAIALPPPRPGVTDSGLRDRTGAVSWYTADGPVLLRCIRQAATSARFYPYSWRLAWAAITFFSRQGHWRDWASAYDSALQAACRLGDPIAQGHMYHCLGTLESRLGHHERASTRLKRALERYQVGGDHTGQAHVRLTIAMASAARGSHPEALNEAWQALELYQMGGHHVGQANALTNIGWILGEMGDYPQAVELSGRALALHQTVGHSRGEAASWDNLGVAHTAQGATDQAIACLHRSLGIYQGLNDSWGQADVLLHLGDAYHFAGEQDAARDAWLQALQLLDDLGHPGAEQLRAKLKVGSARST